MNKIAKIEQEVETTYNCAFLTPLYVLLKTVNNVYYVLLYTLIN